MRSKSSKSAAGRQARNKSRKSPDILPPALTALEEDIFGAPDLLPCEDPSLYERLVAGISKAVAPADAVELIWVRDIVYITWEMQRLRTYKARRLSEIYVGLVKKKLTPEIGSLEAGEAVEAWLEARGSGALQSPEEAFADLGLDWSGIAAEAYFQSVGLFERLDNAIAALDLRRSILFREMERRRDILARRMRDSVRDIEAASVEVMDARVIRVEHPASDAQDNVSPSGGSPDEKAEQPDGAGRDEVRTTRGSDFDAGARKVKGNRKRRPPPDGAVHAAPASLPGLFDGDDEGSDPSAASGEAPSSDAPGVGELPTAPKPSS